MITVQAAGCAPIVKAWEAGKSASRDVGGRLDFCRRPARAEGLRGLSDSRHSEEEWRDGGGGHDEEILAATRHWASVEGVFAAPEGAASLVAYRKLRASGFLRPEDKVVLFNTGSAYKYLDMIEAQENMVRVVAPAARNIGGIIGPY